MDGGSFLACQLLHIFAGTQQSVLFAREAGEYKTMAPQLVAEALVEAGQENRAAPIVHGARSDVDKIDVAAHDDGGVGFAWKRAEDIRRFGVGDRLLGQAAAFATHRAEE